MYTQQYLVHDPLLMIHKKTVPDSLQGSKCKSDNEVG